MYLKKHTCICWWLCGVVQFKWVRCLCTFTLGREVNPADYASSGNAIFYAVLWPSCGCHSLSGCTHHALFSFCPVRRTMCFFLCFGPFFSSSVPLLYSLACLWMFATLCSTAALLQYDCTANTTSEPECNKMSSKQTCVERASNETAITSMGFLCCWEEIGSRCKTVIIPSSMSIIEKLTCQQLCWPVLGQNGRCNTLKWCGSEHMAQKKCRRFTYWNHSAYNVKLLLFLVQWAS